MKFGISENPSAAARDTATGQTMPTRVGAAIPVGRSGVGVLCADAEVGVGAVVGDSVGESPVEVQAATAVMVTAMAKQTRRGCFTGA